MASWILYTVLLLFCTSSVYGQIGVTTCSFATQTLCGTNIQNSVCDVVNGVCVCLANLNYVNDGTGFACTYNCKALTAPTNGGVSTAGGTYTGNVATYSCNNGYKISGNATRTCVQDSGWSGTSPTCTEGVIGDDCSASIFLCLSINFGTCKDLSTCVCQAGYEDDGTGKDCVDINECASSPCQNGATCNDQVNGYTCTCVAGYTGTNCETNINECIGNVCVNGATCVDGINQYTCDCVAGYDGQYCGNKIDERLAAPCKNGATCADFVNSYTCLLSQTIFFISLFQKLYSNGSRIPE